MHQRGRRVGTRGGLVMPRGQVISQPASRPRDGTATDARGSAFEGVLKQSAPTASCLQAAHGHRRHGRAAQRAAEDDADARKHRSVLHVVQTVFVRTIPAHAGKTLQRSTDGAASVAAPYLNDTRDTRH